MALEELPIDDQRTEFERIVRLNPVVEAILARLEALALPDCWLSAGALFQTVWNVLSQRDPAAGIRDYDINYSDAPGLSWDAEAATIRAALDRLAGIEAEIEIRNE